MEYKATFLIIFILACGTYSMTRQQIKKTAKIVKKNCMGKNNVTEELIGDIEKGKFIEERPVMCYIACVYQTTQIIKNNKISYESSVKQVQMNYPAEMKEAMLVSIENCKGIQEVSMVKKPATANFV